MVTNIYASLSIERPKDIYRLRCSHCGKYRPKNIREPCKECSRRLTIVCLRCPRCGCNETIKGGLTKYGIQIWRCKKCLRCFREYTIDREDYEFRYGVHQYMDGYGRCLKCGADDKDLLDGLCCSCSDNVSYGQTIYYRHRYKGLCVCCKSRATHNIYCSKHKEYHLQHNRKYHKGIFTSCLDKK